MAILPPLLTVFIYCQEISTLLIYLHGGLGKINLLENDSGEKANFILGCHYINQLISDSKSKAIERSLEGEERSSMHLAYMAAECTSDFDW
ncbi:hypothetical protein BTVI_106163 [Pitangus sulphuratus]|nr:hypothetical protein BTVI_106163 [Pitangus sulphuratus]